MSRSPPCLVGELGFVSLAVRHKVSEAIEKDHDYTLRFAPNLFRMEAIQ
jgi:hypothetical protein